MLLVLNYVPCVYDFCILKHHKSTGYDSVILYKLKTCLDDEVKKHTKRCFLVIVYVMCLSVTQD